MSLNEGRQSRAENTTAAKKPLLQHDFPGGRVTSLCGFHRTISHHLLGRQRAGAPHWACRPSSGKVHQPCSKRPQGPARQLRMLSLSCVAEGLCGVPRWNRGACLLFFLSRIIFEISDFQSQKGGLKFQIQLSTHSSCSNVNNPINVEIIQMNPCSQRGWGCERFLQGRLMSPFPHRRQQIPRGSLGLFCIDFFFSKLGKRGRFCPEALCE